MNNKRLRLILLGLIAGLVVVFIVICFAGLSALSKQSQKMVSYKLQSKVLDDQLTSLTQAKKQVQQYSYLKNVVASIIPNDKDQAQAVLQIFQLADQAGISIQNITFPTSSLGLTSTNASTASASTAISQAKPVDGIQGLYSLQLDITPETGPQVPANRQLTYAKMLDFLDRIERNQRTAQINSVNVQLQSAGGTAKQLTLTLSVNIFIKP